jgi:drug/metabolite transporter (DMT)-like permease
MLESIVQLQALVLLLCALYGSVFAFGKLTLEYAPPLFITGGRMILAAILLLLYQFIFNRKNFIIKKQHLWPICIIGLTNIYLTNALEFWGLQYMEAGKACFIYSFSPIATAILSYFWFSEKITSKKCLGLFIGGVGFLPILLTHSNFEDTSGSFGFFTYAELAILGAAVATSIGWMTMRVMVKKQGVSGVMANAGSMLVGGCIALLHSYAVEPWNPTPITEFLPFLEWFLILTLVSNIISYNLNAYLLRHFTATYLSFAGLTQPLFAVLFGWLFLNEVMNTYFWVSVVIVSFGLYLYYQEELKQGHAPTSVKR